MEEFSDYKLYMTVMAQLHILKKFQDNGHHVPLKVGLDEKNHVQLESILLSLGHSQHSANIWMSTYAYMYMPLPPLGQFVGDWKPRHI